MKKEKKAVCDKELLPFAVINRATKGDVEALHKVLEYYESYIIKLSTRVMYDEYDQVHYWIDEELKRRLELRLIATTMKFRINRR